MVTSGELARFLGLLRQPEVKEVGNVSGSLNLSLRRSSSTIFWLSKRRLEAYAMAVVVDVVWR